MADNVATSQTIITLICEMCVIAHVGVNFIRLCLYFLFLPSSCPHSSFPWVFSLSHVSLIFLLCLDFELAHTVEHI